jgi:hypothetical protein
MMQLCAVRKSSVDTRGYPTLGCPHYRARIGVICSQIHFRIGQTAPKIFLASCLPYFSWEALASQSGVIGKLARSAQI